MNFEQSPFNTEPRLVGNNIPDCPSVRDHRLSAAWSLNFNLTSNRYTDRKRPSASAAWSLNFYLTSNHYHDRKRPSASAAWSLNFYLTSNHYHDRKRPSA